MLEVMPRPILSEPPEWATYFSWEEPAPFEPERILELLPSLVSSRTGIIHSLSQLKHGPTEPRTYVFQAVLADLLHSPEIHSWFGTGIGLTIEEAIGSSVGEALERYCLFNAGRELGGFIRATYAQVAEWAIDPLRFSRCSDNEYALCPSLNIKLTPPSHDTVYSWAWGYSLTQKRPVLVPASLVYPGIKFDPVERLLYPLSSGSALGQSLLQATLQGLYEVLERDAFTIHWLNRLPAPRLNLEKVSSQSKIIAAVVKSASRSYVKFELNNMTTELGVPVVFCTCLNKGERIPGLVVGASANLDPEIAIRKALLEAIHCRVFFTEQFRNSTGVKGKLTPEQVSKQDHHVLLYTQPEMVSSLDFLTEAPETQTLEDITPLALPQGTAGKLNYCVERLAQSGMEAIVVDLTAPDIAEFGYRSVKVLVPEAQPLSFGKLRYLSGPRLYQLPARLGYTDQLTSEATINPLPHPFP